MSEILERAALAIYAEAAKQGPELASCFGYAEADHGLTILDGGYDLKAFARAVIEAMREPAHQMKQAGWQALPVTACDSDPSEAEDVWKAMVDAALK